MIKNEIALSQQDRDLLLRLKKNSKIQLVFGFFVIPIFIIMSVVFFWLDCAMTDKMMLFLFFGTVSGFLIYAFNKIYLLQKTLDEVLAKNKKIVLEAQTRSQFIKNADGNYQFFKDDETFYSFQKLKYALHGNYIKKLTYFPENTFIKLEYANPGGFVFNYETIENQAITKPFQTKILPLKQEDKKRMRADFFILFKIINFILFPLFLTIMGFVNDWKFDESGKLLVGISISILIVINIGLGIWFLFLWNQLQNPNKIVITGKVTEVVITSRKYGRALLFFGLDSFPVFSSLQAPVASVGDMVEIHYLQKQNNKIGSLIRVEKII